MTDNLRSRRTICLHMHVKCGGQRPVLNFAPRGKVGPQGWILSPGSWSYPLGVKFSVRPSILLNNRECSPLGGPWGVNFTPRGQISPQGDKLTPAWVRHRGLFLRHGMQCFNNPMLLLLLLLPSMSTLCCHKTTDVAFRIYVGNLNQTIISGQVITQCFI
jgi:hypothetical protein